jgi:epsilon-lactone hydrolase
VQNQGKPTFSENGTVRVPAFELPPSELSSPEARAMQALRAKMPVGTLSATADIHTVRAGLEAMLEPQVIKMREVYSVDIAEQTVGGIPTHVVTPRSKPYDDKRVLINLHGGAFSVCAGACSLLESIPVAALGG